MNNGNAQARGLFALGLGFWALTGIAGAAEFKPDGNLDAPPASLWEGRVGEGFRNGANELDASFAAGLGTPIFGSTSDHNWVLGVIDYGWIFSDVVAKDRWYQGNLELVADFFGGFQYYPDHGYVFGTAPLLRYDFVTGTRWVPFANAGAGVTGTDIRDGDLSTRFEFNLQIGAGVHYFMKDNLALTLQYRFIHISNAGMDAPNNGVNSNNLMLGASWFF